MFDARSDGAQVNNQNSSTVAAPRRRLTKVELLEDLLPEYMTYRDSGCEVAPACLSCPLPICRYEIPGGIGTIRRQPRNDELLALHRQGASIDRLCRQFDLSRRSVFRILAAARRKGN